MIVVDKLKTIVTLTTKSFLPLFFVLYVTFMPLLFHTFMLQTVTANNEGVSFTAADYRYIATNECQKMENVAAIA